MKRRPFSKSRQIARKYPKSEVRGSCFGKTIYPCEDEARKGITIMWGKDPHANINDLHAYQCPDGCKGWHIGHRSFFMMTQKVENAEAHA